ncbi:MerC domain-containing protein [Novosphingobium tardum]|jgi:hypothetical protein|uniref:MerC domain-containing protein n=1 Tax=Novosphingobium tardum TaxID=1538021 RepID=A0ABV8RKI0_9SPHN
MSDALLSLRDRFDRLGILLSGLCAVHCLATLLVVVLFGVGGGVLANPAIHEVGLALAIVVGSLAIGLGVYRHRNVAPLLIGGAGLSLMATALAARHGPVEALLTICGVALVAFAHWRNVRHLA